MTDTYTCPSARAEPGAQLLGLLGSDGRIHNVRTALTIGEDFIEEASKQGAPEARMRFANTCVEGKCSQWTGERCGIIDKVLDHLAPTNQAASELPPCSIRAGCRWHKQHGASACAGCALVVTDQAAVAAE